MSCSCTSRRETLAVFGILAAATILKIAWALSSIGSSDTWIFYHFGTVLQRSPLRALYQVPIFNHTPLTGVFVRTLFAISHGNLQDFATLLRIPGILADVGLVMGMWHVRRVTGRPPLWALCLFAASPVSMMVSGFHGNVDPVMVMLLFFAGIAVLHGTPGLCGVLFAAACNVKMMPILFTPIFVFYWWARGWRPALRFAVPFALVMIAGSAVPLIECPQLYIRNVFGYGGYWGGWGITYWLTHTGAPTMQESNFTLLGPAQRLIVSSLKAVIIAATLAFGWRRRRLEPVELFGTFGAVWAVFYVFAPGGAVQYMVWFAPFVLLLAPRWWAALTLLSSAYMFMFYHSTSKWTFPWHFALSTPNEVHYWLPWTHPVWGAFIAFLIAGCRQWWTPRPLPVVETEQPAPEPAVAAA